MPIITIRVNDELFQKIEEKKGEKTTSSYCRDIIDKSLNEKVYNEYNSAEIDTLKLELQQKNDTLRLKDERIHDMQNTLGWLQDETNREIANSLSQINYLQSENSKLLDLLSREQALNLQTQKLLSEAKETKIKKWWQLWKK